MLKTCINKYKQQNIKFNELSFNLFNIYKIQKQRIFKVKYMSSDLYENTLKVNN